MKFNSLKHAEIFKKHNFNEINDIVMEVEMLDAVAYADVWLNSKAPSFVAGLDCNDQLVVCFPISLCIVDSRGKNDN